MKLLIKLHYATKIFDLEILHDETKFFEICTAMRFLSLFSLIERNIAISLSLIRWKRIIVLCSNKNSSIKNKLFSKYTPSGIYRFIFLNVLFIVVFTGLFSQSLQKNCYFLKHALRCFKMYSEADLGLLQHRRWST